MVDGIDVSTWQGKINFATAFAAGARFVFIKSSQNNFVDNRFADNWPNARGAGFLRGAYHFGDYRYRGDTQAGYMAGLLRADPGELAPVLDVEKYWTPYPGRANWLSWIRDFVTTIQSEGLRRPIFYSNPDLIVNVLAPLPDWLLELDLWIAHYTTAANPIIGRFPRWRFWQKTATASGPKYGVESKGVDFNVWNGSLEDLRAYAGQPAGGCDPQPDLSIEEKVNRLWAVHPEIWDGVGALQRCAFCNGMTASDARGNCAACGGPR